MDNDGISDKRHYNLFVPSDLDDMTDLSPEAMRVYMHLVRRANGQKMAYPSYRTIGDHCFSNQYKHEDTRKDHAIEAIRELVDAGLITKTLRFAEDGDNTSNLYTLLDVPQVGAVASVQVGAVEPHKGNPFEGTLNINVADATENAPAVLADKGKRQRKPRASAKSAVDAGQHRAMFAAVATTCELDPRLSAPMIGKTASKLLDAGYTPDEVRDFRRWWDDDEWRKDKIPGVGGLLTMLPQYRNHPVKSAQVKKNAYEKEGIRPMFHDVGQDNE